MQTPPPPAASPPSSRRHRRRQIAHERGRPHRDRPGGRAGRGRQGVAAANRITRKPYKWGGGHGRWRDTGYDCSGTVSYVLHAAGLLKRPRDSTGFMSYGQGGVGEWITVYAHGSHAYMTIAGLRFDTSGQRRGRPALAARAAQRRRLRQAPPGGPVAPVIRRPRCTPVAPRSSRSRTAGRSRPSSSR